MRLKTQINKYTFFIFFFIFFYYFSYMYLLLIQINIAENGLIHTYSKPFCDNVNLSSYIMQRYRYYLVFVQVCLRTNLYIYI